MEKDVDIFMLECVPEEKGKSSIPRAEKQDAFLPPGPLPGQ